MGGRRNTRRVAFTLVFKSSHGPSRIANRARHVSDPRDPTYGHYLSRAALARAIRPPARAVANCRRWFERQGMHFDTIKTYSPQFYVADASASALRRPFGVEAQRSVGDPDFDVSDRSDVACGKSREAIVDGETDTRFG